MSRKRRKPRPTAAHYTAPVAFLLGVTIAVLLVHSAFQGNGGSTSTASTTAAVSTTAPTTTRRAAGGKQRFYTVQAGDTFGSIAAKESISVEQLQSLNPGVSSNALSVGQKLRVK